MRSFTPKPYKKVPFSIRLEVDKIEKIDQLAALYKMCIRDSPYTITALSESVKFLYINLHLRMPTKLPSPANPACLGIADGNSDIHYVPINLFLPPHIPVCPHNNAYILLNLIRYEVEHRPIGRCV